jgi:hypothetical protein
MVQRLLERLDYLTRYDIHTAAGEPLEITRRNEGVEWAKFTVRDPSLDPIAPIFEPSIILTGSQTRYPFLQ